MRRFFSERNNLRVNSSVKMPETEAQHIRDTLRMQKGEHFILFNGEQEFEAELGLVTKDVVMANIIADIAPTESRTTQVDLYMAMIKPANFELVLQKTTEVGVNAIFPVNTEYSQVPAQLIAKKQVRWEKIILEACKQSERTSIPQLNQLQNLNTDLLTQLNQNYDQVIVLTLQRQTNLPVADLQLTSSDKIAVLVGPEGGFSRAEHELFSELNITQAEILSGAVLRAETAAIVGCGIILQSIT